MAATDSYELPMQEFTFRCPCGGEMFARSETGDKAWRLPPKEPQGMFPDGYFRSTCGRRFRWVAPK